MDTLPLDLISFHFISPMEKKRKKEKLHISN